MSDSGLKYDPKYEELFESIKFSEFIVLNGLPSVGKTTLLKYVLSLSEEYISSYINCNSIASSSHLYNEILTQLVGRQTKAVGIQDFVSQFEDLIRSKTNDERYIVALDRIEFLKKTSILDSLQALSRVRNLNLIIVTNESATCVIDDYFKSDTIKASLKVKLVEITINPWPKADIVNEITRIEPKESTKLYRKFVNNIVQIVYLNNTRDFVELRTYCQENFSKFLVFYKQKMREYLNIKLKNIRDEDLEDYALPSVQEQKIVASFLTSFKDLSQNKFMMSMANKELDRKVVIYTSTLIVAAYIAANTKPSDDKRNFIKLQKKRAIRDKPPTSNTFTLERLLHIFRSLMSLSRGKCDDEQRNPLDLPDSVLADVSILEDLRFLIRVSGDGLDSLTRYQFSDYIERSYVERLANQSVPLENIHGLP